MLNTKTITILFTQNNDWFSYLLVHILKHKYTHVCISLDSSTDNFFSFNTKGFCHDSISKFRHIGIKNSISYDIAISINSYNLLNNIIKDIEHNKISYKYSFLGVLFCMLRVPIKWKYKYFCSQFVAELLKLSHAIDLKKKASLYLPEYLRKELENNPNNINIIENIV